MLERPPKSLLHTRSRICALRVLSKAQILDRVWSYDFGGRSSIVEIYISYLRKKVEAGLPAMIHTVRGVGYTIKPASGSATPPSD